jgi:hypothetical protein
MIAEWMRRTTAAFITHIYGAELRIDVAFLTQPMLPNNGAAGQQPITLRNVTSSAGSALPGGVLSRNRSVRLQGSVRNLPTEERE